MRNKLIIFTGLVFLGIGILYVFLFPGYNISTTGTLYIVNKASRSVSLFDLEVGETIKVIPLQVESHEATALTNNEFVVIANYGNESENGETLTVINAKTNKIEKIIDIGPCTKPHGLVRIPNTSKVLVAADIGNTLMVVNIETGVVEKSISTEQCKSHLVAMHPNNTTAYLTNVASNSVSVIDLDSSKVTKIIQCGKGTIGLDVSPDGKELWVTNNQENSISVINTNYYEIKETLITGKQPLGIKFTTDGKRCLVANGLQGTISVFDAANKELVKVIHIPGNRNKFDRLIRHTPRPVSILMHPNGKYAFIANSNASQVEVVDLKQLIIVSTIPAGGIPDGMAFVEG